jgi:hypothetical protein
MLDELEKNQSADQIKSAYSGNNLGKGMLTKAINGRS